MKLCIVVLIIGFIIWLCVPKSRPAPKTVRRVVNTSTPPKTSRWIVNTPAPPLPLSTMYSIRIGREVTSRAGPGDSVWNYDHSRITGPRYG